jgi:hypothetical protein
MLELDLAAQEEVERGIETEGSNLSGVSARCSWADVNVQQLTPGASLGEGEGGLLREGPATRPEPLNTSHISEQQSQQIKAALKKGLLNTKPILPPIGRPSNLDKYGIVIVENMSKYVHIKCVACHHDMAHPQVADGGKGLRIWGVVVNTVKPHIYVP